LESLGLDEIFLNVLVVIDHLQTMEGLLDVALAGIAITLN